MFLPVRCLSRHKIVYDVVEQGEVFHVTVLQAAELVVLSRKRIDNDGPKSACQSANFQRLNGLGRFQPRELHPNLLRGSQLDPSTLQPEFEQLDQAGPRSGHWVDVA